jgi:hypothetical protein
MAIGGRAKGCFATLAIAATAIVVSASHARGDMAAFTMRTVALNGSPVPSTEEVAANPGDTLTIEFYVEGWAPVELIGYQLAIDGASLTSGESGSLELARIACGSDADCFGESLCADGICNDELAQRCSVTDQDCWIQQCQSDEDCFGLECDLSLRRCSGQVCEADPAGTACDCYASMFIDRDRADYIFPDGEDVVGVDCRSPFARAGNYRLLSEVCLLEGEPDPGSPRYLGTITFTVSDDASGDFFIRFLQDPDYTRADSPGCIEIPTDKTSTITVHTDPQLASIPAVSEWGLLILGLLLLVGAKIRFRRAVRPT